MSGISGLGSSVAPSADTKAIASKGGDPKPAASKGGDTTSTVTDPNGSTTTTVSGPTGAVLSVSTVTARGGAAGTALGGVPIPGSGSPASAGLLNISA